MTGSDPRNPWIVRPRANPHASLRLVCFAYAGGGASVFRTWPAALPANVEILAVELPGRDTRFREPPISSLATLIPALGDALAGSVPSPFAIYGHSLGALVGFSLARELRRRGTAGPVHLFVSGRRAPHLVDPSPMYRLPEPQFLAGLRELGGVPDVVFQEPELMALFLPALRADFALNDAEALAPEPALACPITAWSGQADEKAPPDEVDAWRIHTAAAFEHESIPGGHFFLQTAHTEFLGALSRGLSRIAAVR
jgi:medium-chain acyl-[acyl-carrier-protein] hydrolase